MRGGPPPWETPELSGVGRLPMHSVPHRDRVVARRRVALPAPPGPDAEPAPTLGRGRGPGRWTMQAPGDLPHYTNVQMPFPGLPPAIPAAQPDRRLRARRSRSRRGWAGRRVVLHVGAAESVLRRPVNGDEVGIAKDSHLAAEFDVRRVRPAGVEHALAHRREVVGRDVRRGPGPVVARRASPGRCSCTPPTRSTSPTSGRSPALGGDLRDRIAGGHASRSRSRAVAPEPGWTVEAERGAG